MRRRAMTLAAACALAGPATAQSIPAPITLFVSDYAEVIDAETEARITETLRAARADKGLEFAVVTIGTRNDYGGASEGIAEFGTRWFNTWGIGDPERNDGILVLVAVQDREMRIALGAGYGPRMDDVAKDVIDHHFIPWFRDGNYAEGIEAGVGETLRRVRMPDDPATLSERAGNLLRTAHDYAFGGGFVSAILAALGLGGGAFGIRQLLRIRPRKCDLCGRRMVRLDETADDNWLAHGARVEESLKSTDYDVWYCAHDDHVMIEGYRNWFTSYGVCPNCGYRTLHSQREVLVAATTSHSGRARVDYNCRNCQHSYSETVTIPSKSESSSSSSSGFSGGSSSGGGASGSW